MLEAIRTTRRRLLAYGLGGTAALAFGGALAWSRAGYALAPGDAAVALSVKELAVVRALVEALLPAAAELPSGVAVGVHQRIDEEVWAQSEANRGDLKLAIQVIEHAPPFVGFAGRMTSLRPAARLGALDALLRRGPDVVVQAVVAIKQLAHLEYYGSEQVWPHIGYDGPWVKQPAPPPSAIAYRALFEAMRSRA